MIDSRYSKDQLLDLFRAQGDSGNLYRNPSDHLVEGWNPNTSSVASNGAWNRRDDHKDGSNGPEICWDHEGSIQPLGLMEPSEEEMEVFAAYYVMSRPIANPGTVVLSLCEFTFETAASKY